MGKKLSPVMEDYLETIAFLKKEKSVVRVKDISKASGVKNPTVNSALKTLSEKGLVKHQKYGYVDITLDGLEAARSIQKKHNLIFKFLADFLGINKKEAAADACKMEHSISSETFKRLTKFISFIETGPGQKEPQWLRSFQHYLKTGKKLKCKMRYLAEKKGK